LCRQARLRWHFPIQRPYQSRFEFAVIDQMKRQQKYFSVEIKKARTQGQRHHLPPWRLFDVAPPKAETDQILQNEAVPKVAAPTAAPRILPSIVEPMWNQAEPAALVHRKRSPEQTTREQMDFDLGVASEDVNGVPAETPMHAEAALPTATTASDEAGATPTLDVQPVSGKRAKSHARKTRTKAAVTVEPAQAPEPAPKVEPTPHSAVIEPSMKVLLRSNERRLTKRLAAASQLPRSQRWKRRLHPETW
jgi:hypothetical protein